MNTVILAGGPGSRLGDATEDRPKALVTIGGEPIICHVMQTFIAFGHASFVIASGHHSQRLMDYFTSPNPVFATPEVRARPGSVTVRDSRRSAAGLTIVDTGLSTGSAGRLRRLREYLDDESFFLTYCDGLADINLKRLLEFHTAHGKTATVTAVRSPPRFRRLHLEGDRVTEFEEKPMTTNEWINGGFFVVAPEVLGYVDSDEQMFENGPLERLAAAGELMAFRHEGFWDCMDDSSDRRHLESLYRAGDPPWRIAGQAA